MSAGRWTWAACLGWVVLASVRARGQVIPVPNGSFEDPSTAFVDLRIEPWQRTEKPGDYDEGGGFLWGQLVGVFANTAAGKPDHVDNLHGRQAVWVFAVSGAGFWQEIGPANSVHPVRYEPGKAYQLEVDVLGNGGGMAPGVPLEVGLGVVAPDGSRSWVAKQTIVNSPELFPVRTRMTSFRVVTPVVAPGDAWAGRPVAVMAVCTVSREQEGGYWDIDHFRVEAVSAPTAMLEAGSGGWGLAWNSSRGWRYRAWRSTDLLGWSPVTGLLPGTGETLRIPLPGVGDGHGFYRVEWVPGE